MPNKRSQRTARYLAAHPPAAAPKVSRAVVLPRVQEIRRVKEEVRDELKLELRTQAGIWDDIKRMHGGDVPPRLCWNHLADRREAVLNAGRMQQQQQGVRA